MPGAQRCGEGGIFTASRVCARHGCLRHHAGPRPTPRIWVSSHQSVARLSSCPASMSVRRFTADAMRKAGLPQLSIMFRCRHLPNDPDGWFSAAGSKALDATRHPPYRQLVTHPTRSRQQAYARPLLRVVHLRNSCVGSHLTHTVRSSIGRLRGYPLHQPC